MLEVYVDGSCSGNGKAKNKGGYGIVYVEDGNVIKTYAKSEENTTNNRMEMSAILSVFFKEGKKPPAEPITVYSDSAYCVNTFTDWMFVWASRGWIKSNGLPPENLDLIKSYFTFYKLGYRINLKKIKGHAGFEFNELADKLAKGEIEPSA